MDGAPEKEEFRDDFTDEFLPYLAERMKEPNFARYYRRAEQRVERGHLFPAAVKANRHRRGWRRKKRS